MFRALVLFAAVAALGGSPALAADEPVAPAQTPIQTETQQQPASGNVRHCWKENPYNEYRDCVNASTRDPNAKIRMA